MKNLLEGFLSASERDLREHIVLRRKQLMQVEKQLIQFYKLNTLFLEKQWYLKVEEQLKIWEENTQASAREKTVTIPEYELFRYFIDDSILPEFVESFNLIESKISTESRNQINQWNSTKSQLFSQNVSQIYSSIFEMLMLRRLLINEAKVDIYFKNIDGRMKIDNRYLYFEIKSMQKTKHDLSGIGPKSTKYDRQQIYRSLRDKNRQLYPYRDSPTIIFLSLFRLADMTTADWYINEYFDGDLKILELHNEILSGVMVSSWFCARGRMKIFFNEHSKNELSKKEKDFFLSL